MVGASIDPQPRRRSARGGDTIQETGPSQKAGGRQDWRSRELLQHSTAKQPPQVWVKGGAIDVDALSDGGRRLGVGRKW
jgi:hypothetical protein